MLTPTAPNVPVVRVGWETNLMVFNPLILGADTNTEWLDDDDNILLQILVDGYGTSIPVFADATRPNLGDFEDGHHKTLTTAVPFPIGFLTSLVVSLEEDDTDEPAYGSNDILRSGWIFPRANEVVARSRKEAVREVKETHPGVFEPTGSGLYYVYYELSRGTHRLGRRSGGLSS